MANKYIKRCTVSLAMREIQIKNDDKKKSKIKKLQWYEDFTIRMPMMKIRDVNRYWLGQGEMGPHTLLGL